MKAAKVKSVAIALAAILVILALALPGRDGPTPARAARSPRPILPQAYVRIVSNSSVKVPPSFLGLSTEYSELPHFERHAWQFERVLSLLHAPGSGPMVLRIGGDSADHTFWGLRLARLPRWMFPLTTSWLRQTDVLVRQTGIRLILDLNLVTDLPTLAAEWARAAATSLPRRSLSAFEIGNEPDLYNHVYWLGITSGPRIVAFVLPRALSAATYTAEFRRYARALARVAPGVPLAGPALANPARNVRWVRKLIVDFGRRLGAVTAHRYPYSACVGPRSPAYPTVPRLLSETATAGMARTVGAAVRLAHRAHLPFRLTELNSVTCGGRRGVSDTFATALWAPDALFELLRAGVDSVDVHVRSHTINAAFVLNDHGLFARPLLYGAILFARTLGPGAQLVEVRLRTAPGTHLKAWAVRVRPGLLHVLLIDKGRTSVRVHLRLSASAPAAVERLLAPAAWARSNVTLDGQRLTSQGSWRGDAETEAVAPGGDGYDLTVPRLSAALVTVATSPVGQGQLNSGAVQLGRIFGSPLLTWSVNRGLRFSRNEVTPSTASAEVPR